MATPHHTDPRTVCNTLDTSQPGTYKTERLAQRPNITMSQHELSFQIGPTRTSTRRLAPVAWPILPPSMEFDRALRSARRQRWYLRDRSNQDRPRNQPGKMRPGRGCLAPECIEGFFSIWRGTRGQHADQALPGDLENYCPPSSQVNQVGARLFNLTP
jgi:hypothetical protein